MIYEYIFYISFWRIKCINYLLKQFKLFQLLMCLIVLWTSSKLQLRLLTIIQKKIIWIKISAIPRYAMKIYKLGSN